MQLEEDVPHPLGTNTVDFQRKQFVAERIGWGAMALFLAWALLGGFGEGWLSHQSDWNDEGTVAIEYQRYGRRDAPFDLRLNLQAAGSADRLTLLLNREFIDGVEIERITPAYSSMELDAHGAAARFVVEPGDNDYSITIQYKPIVGGPAPTGRPARLIRRHRPRSRAATGPWRSSSGSGIRWGLPRPRYWPQLAQARCGSLTSPQFGHSEVGGVGAGTRLLETALRVAEASHAASGVEDGAQRSGGRSIGPAWLSASTRWRSGSRSRRGGPSTAGRSWPPSARPATGAWSPSNCPGTRTPPRRSPP